MNIEEIRKYCLNKKDVEESFPFDAGTLVFKTNGKIFMLASLDSVPLQFNVKCKPDKAVELREEFPDVVLPGYHMNKKHWNTVVVNGKLSSEQIKKMIDDSYDLVKKRKH
jgi:predicted DNA-binding protein (MmcQ/YjbR family)